MGVAREKVVGGCSCSSTAYTPRDIARAAVGNRGTQGLEICLVTLECLRDTGAGGECNQSHRVHGAMWQSNCARNDPLLSF
jgi:hypothetical protein